VAVMSYEEKCERQEARYYGKRCAAALTNFLFHQREANTWRQVDGADGHLTTMWQERADREAKDAIEYATRAMHHARRAQEART